MGGHDPTNSARRSALPRSSWSTVLARIHGPMQSPPGPSESSSMCHGRDPARWRIFRRHQRSKTAGRAMGLTLPSLLEARTVGAPGTEYVLTMSTRLEASSRCMTAARWPLPSGAHIWDYMWRTTPMRRREVTRPLQDSPPAAGYPPGVSADAVQDHDDGTGPLFHRRHRTRIRNSKRVQRS